MLSDSFILVSAAILSLLSAMSIVKFLKKGNSKKVRQSGREPETESMPEGIVGPQCGHEQSERHVVCIVKGKEVKLLSKGPCVECLERYLEKHSTVCAFCGEPILPGSPVAIAWIDAPHPYTHMYMDCCACGALYCGRWGEGELIGLAGGGCVLDVAVATGKGVVGNMDDEGNMKHEFLDVF